MVYQKYFVVVKHHLVENICPRLPLFLNLIPILKVFQLYGYEKDGKIYVQVACCCDRNHWKRTPVD